MATQVALLRGINVGGRNTVAMSDLRNLLNELGFRNALSLLQSGNLIFESDRKIGTALERLLENETARRFDVAIDYVLRKAAQWEGILKRNPFPEESKRDASHVLVMFLKSAPPPNDVKALQAAIRGPELVRADGKELYLVYPDGIGRSKLTNKLIEDTLGIRGTARNWNTVLKLAAALGIGNHS